MATHDMLTRRHLTEAARAAAPESRRRKREAAVARQAPQTFVVRLPGVTQQFGREMRRFSAIGIDRSGIAHLASKSAVADAPRRRASDQGPVRRDIRERIVRLCEAILWHRARRRTG